MQEIPAQNWARKGEALKSGLEFFQESLHNPSETNQNGIWAIHLLVDWVFLHMPSVENPDKRFI